MKQQLLKRANKQCELTKETDNLTMLDLSLDGNSDNVDEWLVLTEKCCNYLDTPMEIDINTWRPLSESIWSSVPAVQVASYRVLTKLSRAGETWANDVLETIYLDEEILAWAKAGLANERDTDTVHVDCNGHDLPQAIR